MPKLRLLIVFGLVAVAVVAAGCGGDDTPTITTASTTASTSPSTTSNPVATTGAPQASTVIGEQGIGRLRLGMSVAQAKATGEIGATGPGCELAGPGELAADLRVGSAVGSVTFRDGVLHSFTVRSGAKTTTGVGPGATVAQIQQAYANGYAVKVDHETEDQFGITLVSVLRDGTQRFGFDVATDTGKARSVSVPEVSFCE